jgi:hypothetical protein
MSTWRQCIISVWSLGAVAYAAGCVSGDPQNDPVTQRTAAIGLPPPSEVPLDPTKIPMFQTQLPILPVWSPTVIKNSSGQVIRNEYTISDSEALVQMLPAGFPKTTVFA